MKLKIVNQRRCVMPKRVMRRYDKEFKINAVNLYLEGKHSVAKLSEELGVPTATLAGWLSGHKQAGIEAFPGKGNVRPGEEEVRRLRKEVDGLRRQRDILKKALAIFSSYGGSDMGL
jgi:transposase-like protein